MSNIQSIVENFVNEIRASVKAEIIAELSNGSTNGHTNGATETVERSEKREKKPVSAALKRSRKLQGRYLGGMRRLNAAQKKQVQKTRAEKGVEAALDLISKMSKINT